MFMVVDVSFWSFTLVSRCFRFSSRSFHTVSRTPPSRVHPFNYQASFLSCQMQKYFHMRVRLSSLMFCTYWILKYTTRAWQQSPRSTTAQLNPQPKKTIFVVKHPFGRSRWLAAISRSFHVPVWLFHVVSHSYHTHFTLFPEPLLPNPNLIIESHFISHQNQVYCHKMKVPLSDVILCTCWSSQYTNRAWQHNTIAKQNAQQISTSTTNWIRLASLIKTCNKHQQNKGEPKR
jgi:hypothetical protein